MDTGVREDVEDSEHTRTQLAQFAHASAPLAFVGACKARTSALSCVLTIPCEGGDDDTPALG